MKNHKIEKIIKLKNKKNEKNYETIFKVNQSKKLV